MTLSIRNIVLGTFLTIILTLITLKALGGIPPNAIMEFFSGIPHYVPGLNGTTGVSTYTLVALSFILIASAWVWKSKGALIASGFLLLLVTFFFFSGFRIAGERFINAKNECWAYQDCGPNEDDIPTYTNQTMVRLGGGQEKVFYVNGEVTLHNAADCYSLNIFPPGVFDARWSNDYSFVTIESYSGEIERAEVTSEKGYSGACTEYWATREYRSYN